MRTYFASNDRKTQKAWLRQQGMITLGADKLVSFKYSSPDDLNTPFRLDTTFSETQLAIVQQPEAEVNVLLHEVFDILPFDLVGSSNTSQVASSEDETSSRKQRKGPLVLTFPFQHELTYRIHPPPGYVPTALPDDNFIRSGPATFQVTCRQEDDHSVRIRASFDSGDGHFTAKEVRELRRQIELLGKGKGYHDWQVPIRFEQTAGKYLEEGRLKEAIQAYHQLCQQSPEDPIGHSHLALAVLQLGLGDLARKHARQAVEIAPGEFQTQQSLGYVLAHNRVGQYLASGYDREGALTAYRKALKLKPDDAGSRWEYGLLLERDGQGVHYVNPENVSVATAEFLKAYNEYKGDDLLDVLVSSQFAAGKYQDAKLLLEEADSSPTRDLLLLAVIAADEGVEVCTDRVTTLWPSIGQRQTSSILLLEVLNSMREYKVAADLARRLADHSAQQQLLLRYAKTFDQRSRYVPDDQCEETPAGLVKSLLAHALIHGCASSRLERYFVDVPKHDNFSLAGELPPWLELFHNRSLESAHLPQRMADIVMEFTCQIADKGSDCFRVKVQHKMTPELVWTAFVVRHEHTLRLCCKGNRYSRIGKKVLELLTDGRRDDARGWLKWVYDLQRKDLGWFDQFKGTPFARLWLTAGNKIQDKDLELAAAALAVSSDSAAKSLDILSAGRDELAAIKQLQVDRALAFGYTRLGKEQELVKLTKTMCEKHSRAIEPAVFQLHALSRIQDIEAIQQFVEKHGGSDELHLWGQRLLAATATATGNMEKATEILTELRQRQDHLAGYMLADVVRLSLFQDPLPEGTVALATESLKGVELARLEDRVEAERHAKALYALALIEDGQLSTAIQALNPMPAVDAESRPDRLDHYALGRIAEACGFQEQAITHFKQVAPFEPRRPNSIYDLAQQRLRRVGVEPRRDDEGGE